MVSPEIPDRFQQFLEALRHPNPNVRAGAALALGKVGGTRTVEPLIETLEDPVHLVYTSAVKALKWVGSPAVGSLIAIIQDPPSQDSATRGYEALRTIQDTSAIDLLIAATRYEEPQIRWGAIEALGNMRAEQAVPALTEATRHPEENTRQHAATALGKIGHPSGIQPVAALLNDPNGQVRQTAAQALGYFHTEAVTLPLLATLRDPVIQVREAAAQGLINLHGPEAVEILTKALNGADAWTRNILARALGKIGDPAAIPALESLALEDDDIQVRLSASQSLAKMGHSRGEAIILRTLNAPSAHTRTLAAIALGNTGNPLATKALLQTEILTGDPKNPFDFRQLRLDVIAALACIGGPAVFELIEALQSPYPGVRDAAFHALHQIGSEAVPALSDALRTTSQPALRQTLIKLLGTIADPRGVEPLADVLRRGVNAVFSFRWMGKILFDRTVEDRKLAADALGYIGAFDGASILLSAARYDLDQEVRERAERALAGLGDADSVLMLAQPPVLGEVSRILISISILLSVGFFTGAFAEVAGDGRVGILAGLAASAVVGLSDGLTAQKRVLRGVAVGLGLIILWGLFSWVLQDRPPLQEIMRLIPVRMGALLLGGLGVITGAGIVNPVSRNPRVRILPRGCLLLILPGILGLAGWITGGVAGAVLVLQADDPGFFRWFGGGTLGILFLITWLQRGARIELQRGLLAALTTLTMVIASIALVLAVPDPAAPWLAALFPMLGALLGWQSLPLTRRLAGLFSGMIAGFLGAGLGVWLMGMVK